LVDAFNPDAKFKALSSSLSGVASGYTALQGAIGLFGEENKQLEKQLIKSTISTCILTRFTGII